MRSHAELFKYTIAAGGTQTVNATGFKLFVRTALQPFTIKFDTGSSIELENGFRFTSEKQFSRLQITNNNAAALYLEFYIGDATVERDAPQYTRDARSTISGTSGPHTVNTLGSTAFAAAAVGKHRKQVVIGNTSATLTLRICKSAVFDGTADIAEIPPDTSFTVFTSDTFWIRTLTGSATALILETLYSE